MSTLGKIRISRNQNMAGALTLPYATNITLDVNDWNAKAVRRERSMRLDYLGDIYTLKFTLPVTSNRDIYKNIKTITKGMVFFVEYYNVELGRRHVMRVYRAATSYNYIGEGVGLFSEVDFEWIGMDTQ